MVKQKMLDIVDKLIDDEKEAIEGYHDAIMKLSDSPRIVDDLSRIYNEESRHMVQLDELKKAIENHEDNVAQMEKDKIFGMCCCGHTDSDGITITEDDERRKKD